MRTTCRACDRPLTDPASRERELGPVCAGKAGGHVPRQRHHRLPEDEVLTGFPTLIKVRKGHRR